MVMNLSNFLNQVNNMTLDQIFGGSNITLDALGRSEMIALIVMVLGGILWCFFGLKLIRVWAAILGFAAGLFLGMYVAAELLNLEQLPVILVGIAAGIVVACLGAVFYRVGIFLVTWIAVISLTVFLLKPAEMSMVLVCAGIGFVAAGISVVFAEPIIIVVTGIHGAVTLGTAAGLFIPIDAQWVEIVAIAVFAVLGIWIQFIMESGKRKKKNLKKAREIREQNSTEREVEKARAMMENLDSIPENDAGKKISHAYEEYEDDDQFDDEYDIEDDDDITYIE